jgi:hypothetical protein
MAAINEHAHRLDLAIFIGIGKRAGITFPTARNFATPSKRVSAR